MEPDRVHAGENINQNQKARNCEGRRKGARQGREPIRDKAHPRGWLVSVANPLSASFRGCNCSGLGSGAFVNWDATSPGGSTTHGHSITDHGTNVLHLSRAEKVETKG